MRTVLKVALWGLGGLATLAVVVFLVATWYVRRPFPKVRGSETVSGLSAPVEIFRDEDGVPHIYATNAADMYFAQGYVHAQDRFWQMEFWRRIGSGTLSELLGESTVDQDRYLRTMGFARVAEAEYERLPDDLRLLMDSYAAGVNAYVMHRKPSKLGLEFALLGLTGVDVEVLPWTSVNSLTWGKVMALDLGLNMDNEMSNLSLVRFGGTDLFELIRAPYRADMPFIVQLDEISKFRREQGLPSLEMLETPVASVYSAGLNGVGSNNWVIGPGRTATGAPILANDMHLGVQMPSIWYEIGLHIDPPAGSTEEPLNLRGFSFAGVPGVIAGQNDHVAWGMTNLGGDVQDLFLERINPDNPDEYWDGDAWQPMVIRNEIIRVEGEDEPVVHRVRSTPRGPVLTDLPQLDKWSSFSTSYDERYPDGASFTELSLTWTALQPETLWAAVTRLNRATSAQEVREALRWWASPAQNLVFADDQGNIGYQSTGVFPDRPPMDARGPRPAWEAAAVGTVPFDDYPAVINPDRGFIVTANNPVVDPSYPYPLGLDYANGIRAARITELIESAEGPIGMDYVRRIHGDVFNLNAAEIVPELLGTSGQTAYATWLKHRDMVGGYEERDEETRADDIAFIDEALVVLGDWDFTMTTDSAGAAMYGFVWKALIEATFRDEAPAGNWPLTGVTTFENVFHTMMAEPDNGFWDDSATLQLVERRDDIVARALVSGLLEAREELGPSIENWQWGDLHQIEFRNATLGESGVGLIERLFNRGPFPLPGGVSTVNVSHYGLREPFDATTIVSERAIYDLADPSNSRFTHPTGQSGHAFNRHYLGFFREWRDVEYHPARWTRDEVEDSAGRRRLTLEPE